MTLSPASHALPTITQRLRSAGCVYAEDEALHLVSAARTPAELDELVARRVSGTPLEHVLGWAEFCGLRIAVDAGVFVPRRRTELLVREAVRAVATRPGAVVVDLCCGSGAVGAGVLAAHPDLELHAVDIDDTAVRCARRNLAGTPSRVYRGDLDAPLPSSLRGRVDVLVANAPYVPTDAIALLPPEARLHEPRAALDGGADGLDLHRRVAAAASTWLAPGGRVVIETSDRQAAGTVVALAGHGLVPRVVRDDDLGATVVVATRVRPASPTP